MIGKGNFSTNGGDGYLNCAEGGGGRAKVLFQINNRLIWHIGINKNKIILK